MQKQFSKLTIHNQDFEFADISSITNIEQIPFSYRILIENILRQKINGDDIDATRQIEDILNYKLGAAISFMPNRILSHDILGKVMLVDFLAYREALQKKGINPKDIQPKVPIDVVIDHSLQVDFFGSETAKIENLKKETLKIFKRCSINYFSENLKNVIFLLELEFVIRLILNICPK